MAPLPIVEHLDVVEQIGTRLISGSVADAVYALPARPNGSAIATARFAERSLVRPLAPWRRFLAIASHGSERPLPIISPWKRRSVASVRVVAAP